MHRAREAGRMKSHTFLNFIIASKYCKKIVFCKNLMSLRRFERVKTETNIVKRIHISFFTSWWRPYDVILPSPRAVCTHLHIGICNVLPDSSPQKFQKLNEVLFSQNMPVTFQSVTQLSSLKIDKRGRAESLGCGSRGELTQLAKTASFTVMKRVICGSAQTSDNLIRSSRDFPI